ncbi:MAG: DNA recombination/repair protein RecA, partial [Chloracidobacterium sp.]
IAKNKLAPPFKEVEFDIIYGKGISRIGDLLDLGVEHKLIEKSGAWFSIKGGERLGQGRENAKQALATNQALCERLEQELRAILMPHRVTPSADTGAKAKGASE